MPHDDILLTVDEVAQVMGKSARTIRRMVGSGRLSATKINKQGGKAYRVPLGALPIDARVCYTATSRAIRSAQEVRDDFSRRGISVAQWASEHGFKAALVRDVLDGRNAGRYRKGHNVAVLLGLKDGEINNDDGDDGHAA